jgi:hypothetical protein
MGEDARLNCRICGAVEDQGMARAGDRPSARRSFKKWGAAANQRARCQAAFYGGEWLLRAATRGTRASLQAAVRICANTSKEYSAATAELKR